MAKPAGLMMTFALALSALIGAHGQPTRSSRTLVIKPAKESELVTTAFSDHVLECEAGGTGLEPRIHWLKDGKRLVQSENEMLVEEKSHVFGEASTELVASTKSRLYLDCVRPEDSGVYTCVAENGRHRVTSDRNVKVYGSVKRESTEGENMLENSLSVCLAKKVFGAPSRIYMYSYTILELIGSSARLICRPDGGKMSAVSWSDPDGQPLPVNESGSRFKQLQSGDLIISDLRWSDMGSYACTATSERGTATIQTFVYPTTPEQN